MSVRLTLFQSMAVIRHRETRHRERPIHESVRTLKEAFHDEDPGSDEIEKRDIDAIHGPSTFHSPFILSVLIFEHSKTRNDRPTMGFLLVKELRLVTCKIPGNRRI